MLAALSLLGSRRSARLVQRNALVYRRGWFFILTGFFEPFFYLLSIGVGLGHLVGDLRLAGRRVTYVQFVAPGMLATAVMNGTIFDSTYGVFHKLKIYKLYEAVLATPLGVGDVALGEIGTAVLRGSIYAAAFLAVMGTLGLALSPWLVACLPAAVLAGFAFAGVGMAATSFMKSFQDFDYIYLATLPLFLFSGTFYPLTVYPGWLQAVVICSPLYQAVALLRALDVGQLGPLLVVHAGYLLILALGGLAVTSRRLGRLILP
jgi:lipooligosaccharide transport system permease protein